MNNLVLGIETSCDETAAAVVAGGTTVLSSVVSSQIDLHARFGGVVPELAGRAHLVTLAPVIDDALAQAGVDGRDCAAVAVTKGPGLIGALLVGVSHAKALALAWDVPFVGVNHLEGHLYACLARTAPTCRCRRSCCWCRAVTRCSCTSRRYGDYTILGGTIDDAAGEAYDKVARVLGLGYPGGPVIDKLAQSGNPKAVPMPRLMRDDSFDFSFSGIKTAVARRVAADTANELAPADVAAGFQKAVVDSLTSKAAKAVEATNAKALCLAGGVAANSELRARTQLVADELGRGLPAAVAGLLHRQRRDDRGRRVVAAAVRRADLLGRRRVPEPPTRHELTSREAVHTTTGAGRSRGASACRGRRSVGGQTVGARHRARDAGTDGHAGERTPACSPTTTPWSRRAAPGCCCWADPKVGSPNALGNWPWTCSAADLPSCSRRISARRVNPIDWSTSH